MAMEDRPEDVLGNAIKKPTAGRPSQAGSGLPGVVGLQGSLTPPTATEQREAAEARAKEEGVKSRPVETSEQRAIQPPPNAAATVATIAQRMEDWAQALATQVAEALAANKELEAEIKTLQNENRVQEEDLNLYYAKFGALPPTDGLKQARTNPKED